MVQVEVSHNGTFCGKYTLMQRAGDICLPGVREVMARFDAGNGIVEMTGEDGLVSTFRRVTARRTR